MTDYPVRAEIQLDAGGSVQAVLDALSPEAGREVPRANAVIRAEGGTVLIDVEAEDAGALRAALNSYLRWASLAMDASKLAKGD